MTTLFFVRVSRRLFEKGKKILQSHSQSSQFSILLLTTIGLALPAFPQAVNLKLSLLWTSNLKSFLESAPIVADINNDGRDEIGRAHV